MDRGGTLVTNLASMLEKERKKKKKKTVRKGNLIGGGQRS